MTERIVVTGGLGFIGSNFLNVFVPKFPEILFTNLDAETYAWSQSNLDQSVQTANNYEFFKADIRNQKQIFEIFENLRPTGVIHFAAETHVDRSIQNPSIFVSTNILGTTVLLEAHHRFGSGCFCYISTDEVYGDSTLQEYIFDEDSSFCPSSPYSASKASAEMFVRAYARTFGLDTIIVRPTNNFWPNQFLEKFIPASICRLLSGDPILLYGSGQQKRDWIFVTDTVRAIWELFRRSPRGEAYNLSADHLMTNLNLSEQLITRVIGDVDPKNYIQHITDRPGHDFCYRISGIKFRKFAPDFCFTEFDLGFQKTLDFYQKILWK